MCIPIHTYLVCKWVLYWYWALHVLLLYAQCVIVCPCVCPAAPVKIIKYQYKYKCKWRKILVFPPLICIICALSWRKHKLSATQLWLLSRQAKYCGTKVWKHFKCLPKLTNYAKFHLKFNANCKFAFRHHPWCYRRNFVACFNFHSKICRVELPKYLSQIYS